MVVVVVTDYRPVCATRTASLRVPRPASPSGRYVCMLALSRFELCVVSVAIMLGLPCQLGSWSVAVCTLRESTNSKVYMSIVFTCSTVKI